MGIHTIKTGFSTDLCWITLSIPGFSWVGWGRSMNHTPHFKKPSVWMNILTFWSFWGISKRFYHSFALFSRAHFSWVNPLILVSCSVDRLTVAQINKSRFLFNSSSLNLSLLLHFTISIRKKPGLLYTSCAFHITVVHSSAKFLLYKDSVFFRFPKNNSQFLLSPHQQWG